MRCVRSLSVIVMLSGTLTATFAAFADDDIHGISRETPTEADKQGARDEPPGPDVPTVGVAQPPLAQPRCANVVSLDAEKCRYAARRADVTQD